MPLVISSKPTTRDYKLVDIDPDIASLIDGDPQEVIVTIRQATTDDDRARGEMFKTTERGIDEYGQQVLRQDWNPHEQRRMEAYLTVVDVVGIEDEHGESLFGKSKTDAKYPKSNFFRGWGLLPSQISRAIHRAVLDMNPNWDPNPKRKPIYDDTSETSDE